MSATFSDVAARAFRRPVWFAQLTLNSGAATVTVRLSDEALRIGTGQYIDGVESWDTMFHPVASLLAPGYHRTSVRIQIRNVHLLDQDLDHTVLDMLNAYYLVGGSVTIFEADEHTLSVGAPLGSTMYATRFTGRIYDIPPGATREGFTILAMPEFWADNEPVVTLSPRRYPALSKMPGVAVVPFVGGFVGTKAEHWFNRTHAIATDEYFDWFNISGGASPAYIQGYDDDGIRVRVSSGSVSDTLHAAAILYATHPTDPDNPYRVYDPNGGGYGTVDETAGTVSVDYVPANFYTTGSPATDEEYIASARFAVPVEDPLLMDSTTKSSWTNWRNALDRSDLTTYATTTSTAKFATAGQHYYGRMVDPDLEYVPVDGYTSHGIAAIVRVTDHDADDVDVRIGYVADGSNVAYADTTITAGDEDWQVIKVQDAGSGANYFMHDDFGASGADYIYVEKRDAAGTIDMALFGVRYFIASRRQLFLGPVDQSADDKRAMSMYFTGYGTREIGTPANESADADEVLKRMLVDGTADDDTPIASGDIDQTSGYGGLTAWQTDLDTSVSSSTSTGVVVWKMAIAEKDPDAKLEDMVARFCESTYSHIWYSASASLWRAIPIETGADVSGVVLYDYQIPDNGITWGMTPLDDMVNAVYVEYDLDPASGRYLRSVWVDNGTVQSFNHTGARDTTREALADTSQELYGRRKSIYRLPYVNNNGCAWDVCVRRFDMLHTQRLTIQVSASMGFGDAIESGYVFTTDASLDNIMRYPGFVSAGSESEPSWSGRKWRVTRITERPYQPFVVEAINVD